MPVTASSFIISSERIDGSEEEIIEVSSENATFKSISAIIKVTTLNAVGQM